VVVQVAVVVVQVIVMAVQVVVVLAAVTTIGKLTHRRIEVCSFHFYYF
jgi:hypothetical protein